jgi:channel protein (hemolysin III family)
MIAGHDESPDKPMWRPRHPVVVGLDLLGLTSALFFLSMTESSANQSYFLAMVFLYSFSTLHHWKKYTKWCGRLDHAMIFIFIAFTAVPYWGDFIPLTNPPTTALHLIVGVSLAGSLAKLFTFFTKYISGALYCLASLPIIFYMTLHWETIGPQLYLIWMLGILFYAGQLVVYTWQLYEVRPGSFGHREVQHILLLTATSLQGYVALTVVG